MPSFTPYSFIPYQSSPCLSLRLLFSPSAINAAVKVHIILPLCLPLYVYIRHLYCT